MAQATDGMSFRAARVYVSPDDATWTDVSGHGASVAVGGGARGTGEQATFDGDTPIVKSGKRASIDVTVNYVYTETAAEPFEVLRAIYETAGGACYVQYAPLGMDAIWYKTGAGILLEPGYPGGDANSGDVVLSQFIVKCAALERSETSS